MVSTFAIPELNRVHIAWDDALLRPTGPQDQLFSQPADVDRIFQALAVSGKKQVVLYVHGGLVSGEGELGGLPFHQNPDNKVLFEALSGSAYPIYFIWESGIKESIRSVAKDWQDELADNPVQFFKERAAELAQTFLFKVIMRYLPKVLADKAQLPAGGFGLGERPEIKEADIEENLEAIPFYEPAVTDYDKFDKHNKEKFLRKLSADQEFMTYLSQVENTDGFGISEQPDTATLRAHPNPLMQALDKDFQDVPADGVKLSLVEDDEGLGLVPVVALERFGALLGRLVLTVGKRFVNKEDHGFAATIFEEFLRLTDLNRLGTLIWSQMKANAQEAYLREDVDGIPHAGFYFIKKLAEYLIQHPDTKVSLVGHSAGAIHLSYFVEAADGYFSQLNDPVLSDYQFSNLTLLAPAVNFEIFQKVLNHRKRIKRLHIFTMTERDEMRASLFSGLSKNKTLDSFLNQTYPCSLLYAVSGLGEDVKKGDVPLLGLARHLDQKVYRGKEKLVKDSQILIQSWTTDTLPVIVWSHNNEVQNIIETELTALAARGLYCAALKHGDFDSDPWTAKSIVALLTV